MTTRVIVSGGAGRMGRLVAGAIDSASDLDLVGLFDPPSANGEIAGLVVAGAPEDLPAADVVVEFTNPDVVLGNLEMWRERGLHAVVGTSGFGPGRITEVESMWGSGPPNCVIVPNFSVGAVLMMHLAELAAPHFPAAEVIELHHDRKADAPSGTALATARRIGAAAPQHREVESAELIEGARGALADGVPVHAVRLPGLVAHQEVMFGGMGETLTIRHDTTDRAAFLPGVLLAVRSVAGLETPVTVGLDALLGL